MDYQGVIIEESLADKSVLGKMRVLETKIGKSQPNTPHVLQWTLHTVLVPEAEAGELAQKLSEALDDSHCEWYADYKNNTNHYIIFKNKIFVINRTDVLGYEQARQYGLAVGVPENQVNFSKHIKA